MAELAEHAPQKIDLKMTALNILRSVFGYLSRKRVFMVGYFWDFGL